MACQTRASTLASIVHDPRQRRIRITLLSKHEHTQETCGYTRSVVRDQKPPLEKVLFANRGAYGPALLGVCQPHRIDIVAGTTGQQGALARHGSSSNTLSQRARPAPWLGMRRCDLSHTRTIYNRCRVNWPTERGQRVTNQIYLKLEEN